MLTLGNTSSSITFTTKSGDLIVRRAEHNLVEMDFPQYAITGVRFPDVSNPYQDTFPEFDGPSHLSEMIQNFIPKNINVEAVAYACAAKKLIVVVDNETTKYVCLYDPDGDLVRGLIVTLAPAHAKSQGFVDSEAIPYDYVCRYFAPWVGIPEDPATGSAQCALAPFWGAILNKRNLYAYQSYPHRGAQFRVSLHDSGRVAIYGQSVTVLEGQIHLNDAIFY
ncbi:unnamed protein product [Nippostrongylus brasiliensis]|uniref:PhzF family phenazine biosynthesis protein n=1 Tax=Nippostrongylus brasiliensis TaxID=27835 RepID=A0A0N4YIP0_NIPBR|nr:unnamed protein product [Nippostrongylus brasiliensis]